jgi:hypothetical protein
MRILVTHVFSGHATHTEHEFFFVCGIVIQALMIYACTAAQLLHSASTAKEFAADQIKFFVETYFPCIPRAGCDASVGYMRAFAELIYVPAIGDPIMTDVAHELPAELFRMVRDRFDLTIYRDMVVRPCEHICSALGILCGMAGSSKDERVAINLDKGHDDDDVGDTEVEFDEETLMF